MLRLILLIAVIVLGGILLFQVNPNIISPLNQSLDQDVRLEIDTGSIAVKDGNVSEALISATITRLDAGSDPRSYELRFGGELKSIYPIDAQGARVTSVPIGPIIGKNAKALYQFRITGSKGEFESAKAAIPVSLYRAGQQVSPTQNILVTVN